MLSDSEEEIVKKIKKAKTDPLPLPENLEEAKKRPEAINLLTIYAALNDLDLKNVVGDYAGKEFSQFKKDLGELASSKLSPISLEMNKLMKDEKYLDLIISNGKDRAINIANPVLSKIYEIIGFFNQ
jgi:tryptophanyl-tRNA synthetase